MIRAAAKRALLAGMCLVMAGCAGCAGWVKAPGAKDKPFYVITHMSNTPEAAAWAIGQGANALEMDLNFRGEVPDRFYHGGLCDCYCAPGGHSVCNPLKVSSASGKACEAVSPALAMAAFLRQQKDLALIVLDDKVAGMDPAVQEKAGRKVVAFLDAHVFGGDFKGKVLIGAAKAESLPFLKAAARASETSPNGASLIFALDQAGRDVQATAGALGQLAPSPVAFAMGASACAPVDFSDTIREASGNELFGNQALLYTWTLDSPISMGKSIDAGANGMITNYPSRLLKVVKHNGIPLARP